MVNRPFSGTQPHDPGYPERLVEFMRTGWSDEPIECRPHPAVARYAARRAALSEAFPGETLVVPSGNLRVRNNDMFFRFRAGSDQVWLTGEQEPDAVLVLWPTAAGHDAILYVWPRSGRDTDEFFKDRAYGELWGGRRPTLAEKSARLGIETADLAGLGDLLNGCAPDRTRVLRGNDRAVDRAVGGDPERHEEVARYLSEARLVKDRWEIDQIQDAVDATVRGFEDVARILPADRQVSQRLIEGVFALRARHDGNDVGYDSVVGGGSAATILHWNRNDGHIRPGELLLMDMGVENQALYTADVTRTLPVSGRFTPLQRRIYDLVYAAQQAGIDAIKPGVKFDDVHQACMLVLAAGLSDLGLLPVSVDEAMDPESLLYRRWTLHGFGHMLGLDVHDCARARKERYREGTLGEGFVLTVEPGLYFQPEDELVPEELRGIGVRIEDDVLVTADGARVLSDGLPRSAQDVEGWLAAQRDAGPRLPG
jgi:Xaa-Pro aminopeptidase